MIRTLLAAALTFAVPATAYAQSAAPAPAPASGAATIPTPAPTPTPDALAFDDPGMHFRPPDGWHRIRGGSADLDGGKKLLAAYVFIAGRDDSRQILITTAPTNGSLDSDETGHESDLRNAIDGTIVNHKERVTLANGMPAFFLAVTEGSDPLHSQKLYEYLVYDGTRTVIAALSAPPFALDDNKAKAALASLYVVRYPASRP